MRWISDFDRSGQCKSRARGKACALTLTAVWLSAMTLQRVTTCLVPIFIYIGLEGPTERLATSTNGAPVSLRLLFLSRVSSEGS
jgi:hypothetical protein